MILAAVKSMNMAARHVAKNKEFSMDGMKISAVDFVRMLPAFMQDDEAVIALSKAIDELINAPSGRLDTIRTWDQIDNLNEAECDEMAWELAIDWYNSTYPIDVKRKLIKSYIITKRKNGTKAAILSVLRSIFEDADVEEWFEYDGPPYTFRPKIEMPANGVVTIEQQQELLENIKYYKSLRSHTDRIEFIRKAEKAAVIHMGGVGAIITTMPIPEEKDNFHFKDTLRLGGRLSMQCSLPIPEARKE